MVGQPWQTRTPSFHTFSKLSHRDFSKIYPIVHCLVPSSEFSGYAHCLDLLSSQGEKSKVYQEETNAVAMRRKHASQGRGTSVSRLECAYLKALPCVEQVGSGFCAKVSYAHSNLV